MSLKILLNLKVMKTQKMNKSIEIQEMLNLVGQDNKIFLVLSLI